MNMKKSLNEIRFTVSLMQSYHDDSQQGTWLGSWFCLKGINKPLGALWLA